jgi:hypothetical protein
MLEYVDRGARKMSIRGSGDRYTEIVKAFELKTFEATKCKTA